MPDHEDEQRFWEGWLGGALAERLVAIREKVTALHTATSGNRPLRWFTPHGCGHYQAVEDLLHRLIPRECHKDLTESEKFFLLASAWLHDLGMIRGLMGDADNTLSDDHIREFHHVRSEQYLAANYASVGVLQEEAAAFGLLARLHRRRCSLGECVDPSMPVPGHGNLRLRILAAYLRLADALHVDVTRAPDDQYAISLAYDIPNSSKLHWLRSMFVLGIRFDTDAKEIVVHFKRPTPALDPNETERMRRVVEGVAELVVDDLAAELDSVKDVLFAADISYFLRVRAAFQDLELSPQTRRDLGSAMNEHFLLDNPNPSSSALFTLLVDSLQDIIAANRSGVGDEIDRFLADIERKLLKSRRCHTGLRNLVTAIRDEWQPRDVPTLQRWILEQRRAWAQKREALRGNAFRFFLSSHLSPPKKPFVVLLYGYSEQVIGALCGFKRAVAHWLAGEQLRAVQASAETGAPLPSENDWQAAGEYFRLFVCEGQPKNRTGWGDRLLFHDGARYAMALAAHGFGEIYVIPDAIACTLMTASPPQSGVDFVMVGANGFDDRRFFHAAGHTMVVAGADLARRQRPTAAPVVVLVVTTDKHGALDLDSDQTPRPSLIVRDGWRFRGPFATEPIRDHMFICQDQRLRKPLTDANVLLYNPREDQVPIDLVDVVITERGVHRRGLDDWSGDAIAAGPAPETARSRDASAGQAISVECNRRVAPVGKGRRPATPVKSETPQAQPPRVPRRYLVRFPDGASFDAAHAAEALPDAPQPVSSRRRHFVSLTPPRTPATGATKDGPRARFEADLLVLVKEFNAQVLDDFHYEVDEDAAADFFTRDAAMAEELAEASLEDVVAKVKADLVWPTTRGQGVTIAVVDTGIDGTHAEFPAAKRAGGWAAAGEDPWTDWKGHGTMCACISTATRAEGGAYEGIAPDAGLISCRTHFYDSELAAIYDYLSDRVRDDGLRIVATNSFGIPTGTPPKLPTSNVFMEALEDALAAGITVVFSAGNNHELAGGGPSACSPNSIWLHKSRADVLVVATCSLDGTLWEYSSRGPGQFFGTDQYGTGNTNRKPDVTAPTPRSGRILYGESERVMPRGWGTSGAAPQVAGLAALLRSVAPGLGRPQLFDVIRDTAQGLGAGSHCQGYGMIDCARALTALP